MILPFDEMMDIEEIIDCADSITECYDELIEKSMYYNLLGEGKHTIKSHGDDYIDGMKLGTRNQNN